MNTQPIATSEFRHPLSSSLHLDSEACPTCGQDIPPERLEEISGRIALREREQTLSITARLAEQYEVERAQAEAGARAELELERSEGAVREALARREALEAAEVLISERLAEAGIAKEAAELAEAALRVQLEQVRLDSAASLAASAAEAEGREAGIRTEATQAAESAARDRLAAIEAANFESEAALRALVAEAESSRIAAERDGAALLLRLGEIQEARDAEVAKVREEAEAEKLRIRQEAKDTAEAALLGKLAAKEEEAAAANAKALSAEADLALLREQQAESLTESLHSQREVLEKANDDAVNAERARSFEENQKLSTKVNELQRQVDRQTNEQLGEGAEVNVYEALKASFPDDDITRIKKGQPGADIRHVVRMRNQSCGTILYDSKNHIQWRTDHVSKLRADQLADKAEHAVLSTHKFPRGTSQLHMQDGIVLANPARVVLVATLIRQHLIQVNALRLCAVERESKTAALYDFIVSDRCTQLLSRVDARAEPLDRPTDQGNQVAQEKLGGSGGGYPRNSKGQD